MEHSKKLIGIQNAIPNSMKYQEKEIKTLPSSLGNYIYNRSNSYLVAAQVSKNKFLTYCDKLEMDTNLLSSDIAQSILTFLELPFVGNYAELTSIIDDWKTLKSNAL